MSGEAIGWVYRHSPYRGSVFAVHLALADSANDTYGYEVWLCQQKLADKARVCRETARDCLNALVADGYLEELDPVPSSNGKPVRRFRFLFVEPAPVVYETRRRPARNDDPTAISAPDPEPKMAIPPAHNGDPVVIEPKEPKSTSPNGDVPQPLPIFTDESHGSKTKTGKPRARNLGWDALVAATGSSPQTRSELGVFTRALKEITEAVRAEYGLDRVPENTAKAVEARAQRYRMAWPDCDLTARGLALHWSRFGPNCQIGPAPRPAAC